MTLFPSLTVLLLFACLVAYEWIKDLRRDLKAAKEDATAAWRLYDTTHRELCVLKGGPAPAKNFADQAEQGERKPDSEPFVPAGIGPTAINDREFRREHAPARSPSGADVSAAASAATNGDGA